MGLAHALAAEVNRRCGRVIAAAIDGSTSAAKRQGLLDALGSGRLRLLCNCAVYVEGLDQPAVSCILLARPCRTAGALTRLVGPALRPWPPDKRHCLILDLSGASEGQSLSGMAGLPGRESRARPRSQPSGSLSRREVRLSHATAGAAFDQEANRTAFPWVEIAPGVMVLPLPPGKDGVRRAVHRGLVVRRLADGRWRVEHRTWPLQGGEDLCRPLWTTRDAGAQGRAAVCGVAETCLAGDLGALRFATCASWRQASVVATPAQVQLLHHLGEDTAEGLTRAAASDRLTGSLARRRLAAEISAAGKGGDANAQMAPGESGPGRGHR